MSQVNTQNILAEQLNELKDYYSNIFVLIEQSLNLSNQSQLEQRESINNKIQNLIPLAVAKFESFKNQFLKSKKEGETLDPGFDKDLRNFIDQTPKAMEIMLSRLDRSAAHLQNMHSGIKEKLIDLQQNKKGIYGYKSNTTKNPRMVNSSI